MDSYIATRAIIFVSLSIILISLLSQGCVSSRSGFTDSESISSVKKVDIADQQVRRKVKDDRMLA